MIRTYDNEKFTNSQFLVFANRFLAVIVAYISLKLFYPAKKVVSSGPPLYQYISFPVQVIAKSIKTIPVMIVGKFVAGKTYPLRQYLLTLLMAVGVVLFLSGYHENDTLKLPLKKATQKITTINGMILLTCYLVSSIL
ncbi:unnamed protein product [Rotaria sp. Silwood1]|nr:unnamed protein product [Rotaria sp. Silwood1]CAF0738027.1 unnamed protein product [Rotaria sp. Silwood1]CAF3334568.1 unnamed protein product [Rotaria sp. Silwood1]CAF3353683.1 unnamed protein product [Rotaria sp. Silwood1]